MLIPRSHTSGSSVWVCDIFQSAPRNSSARNNWTTCDPQSQRTLLVTRETLQNLEPRPVFAAASLPLPVCPQSWIQPNYLCFVETCPACLASAPLHISLPPFPLTAETLVYPKTHLLLEVFPADALHQSGFLSLGLPQHGAHYSVPTFTPSYCSISTCLSPRQKASDRGPGFYLF